MKPRYIAVRIFQRVNRNDKWRSMQDRSGNVRLFGMLAHNVISVIYINIKSTSFSWGNLTLKRFSLILLLEAGNKKSARKFKYKVRSHVGEEVTKTLRAILPLRDACGILSPISA